MGTDVATLEGLAVNGEREVNCVNAANGDDGAERALVEGCQHDGQQNLLEAADEPEIFGDCFEVRPDKVDGGGEGIVSHPFRFDHFFFGFEEK